MTIQEEELIVVQTLREVALVFHEGATGECDHWFKEIEHRLYKRANELVSNANNNSSDSSE
jgi:hypothetical protein